MVMRALALLAASAAASRVSEAARQRLSEGLEAARAGEAQRALELLSTASSLSPQWGLPWLKLANVQLHLQKDAATAEASYERSIALEPSHDAHFFLAKLRASRGSHDQAVEGFEAALACQPASAACREELRRACIAAGMSAGEAELRLLRACCRADVADARSHRALAEALQQHGELTEAASVIEALCAIDPTDRVARFNLGAIRERLGDDRAAVSHYFTVANMTSDPDLRFEAYFNAAACLSRLGEGAEAEAGYKSAIETARNDEEAHRALYNLGNMLRRMEAYSRGGGSKGGSRVADAVECFRRAVELVPTSADAFYQLRRLTGVKPTVTCRAEQPLVVARLNGLPDGVFSRLTQQIARHPWARGPNQLSESFAGTHGFVVRFNREGFDSHFHQHPHLRCLVPFFEAAALPDATVFVMNVLSVRPGSKTPQALQAADSGSEWGGGVLRPWDEENLAVKRHLDITGAICSADHSYLAHQVDVLYVAVPPGMDGGRLFVWTPDLGATSGAVARNADIPPPAEVVTPAPNTWVSFRGDAKHGVERCFLRSAGGGDGRMPKGGSEAEGGAIRTSLVLEQYVVPAELVPLSKTFEVIGTQV